MSGNRRLVTLLGLVAASVLFWMVNPWFTPADIGPAGNGVRDAEVVARARGEAELDALVGEHAGDGGADAAAGAGDNCHLSFETDHAMCSFTVSSAG